MNFVRFQWQRDFLLEYFRMNVIYQLYNNSLQISDWDDPQYTIAVRYQHQHQHHQILRPHRPHPLRSQRNNPSGRGHSNRFDVRFVDCDDDNDDDDEDDDDDHDDGGHRDDVCDDDDHDHDDDDGDDDDHDHDDDDGDDDGGDDDDL